MGISSLFTSFDSIQIPLAWHISSSHKGCPTIGIQIRTVPGSQAFFNSEGFILPTFCLYMLLTPRLFFIGRSWVIPRYAAATIATTPTPRKTSRNTHTISSNMQPQPLCVSPPTICISEAVSGIFCAIPPPNSRHRAGHQPHGGEYVDTIPGGYTRPSYSTLDRVPGNFIAVMSPSVTSQDPQTSREQG